MSTNEIHVGNIGTVLEVTILENGQALDISTATTKEMKFKKPDKNTVTKTAEFVNDGADGKIKYVTVDGDLDVEGTWQIQGHIIMAERDNHSDIGTFKVHANL